MTNKQNAIGVIVGRFQVHKLTEFEETGFKHRYKLSFIIK